MAKKRKTADLKPGRPKGAKGEEYIPNIAASVAEEPVDVLQSLSIKDLLEYLGDNFKLDELKLVYWTFTDEKLKNLPKAEVVKLVADLVSFKDRNRFESFMETLPPYLQSMIRATVHRDYCEIAPIEKEFGIQIAKEERIYYEDKLVLSSLLRVHCFALAGKQFIALREPFRTLFSTFMDLPSHAVPTPLDPEVVPQARWINDELRGETLALAIDNLPSWFDYERKRRVKGAFKKRELAAFRAKIGLELFPLSGKKGPDPVALLDSFICAFNPEKPKRPKDIDEWIRQSVALFFFEYTISDSWTRETDALTGSSFEYFALCPHLSDSLKSWVFDVYSFPYSRASFRDLLVQIARSGDWYAVESLMISLEARNHPRLFWSQQETSYLYRKVSGLKSLRYSIFNQYEFHLYAKGPFTHDLVEKPLFCAYFYLMALLGIVELAEDEPTTTIESAGKILPVSPWSYLGAVRVTAFGRWCLGLDEQKPAVTASSFEAIAATDLLLVTFRGRSLERKLYLESIGEAFGAERYRITLASFMRGCQTPSDVHERIKRFASLIEPNPSHKWKELFETAIRRSRFFQHCEEGYLFDTGENTDDLWKILASDSKLSKLARRVEGNRLFVSEGDLSRFAKLLEAHGFLFPPFWK